MASSNFQSPYYPTGFRRIANAAIGIGIMAKKHTVAGEVVVCGAGGVPDGVACNNAAAGESVTVSAPGTLVPVKLGGPFTFATESRFKSDASGQAVVIASNNDVIAGILYPGPENGLTGASGDLVTAILGVPASHGA